MGLQADAMKGAVFLTVGLMIFAAAMAVTTETESYAEMAVLEQDDVDHTPKVPADDDEQAMKEVKESLIQEKEGRGSVPSGGETAFDEKADSVNPTSLFPGPVYGLPGYKESHDWLKDVDWWSPLVFEWRYYKARCAEGCVKLGTKDEKGDPLKDMDEGQVKKYWLEKGMDNGDVATPNFSCEYYVTSNEDLHETLLDENKVPKCKKAVQQFLTDGLFDGLSGTSFDGEHVSFGEGKTYQQITSFFAPKGHQGGQIQWSKNYAWTFWYKRTKEERRIMPVFAVRRKYKDPGEAARGGWWGGYPFFVAYHGSMMFCATTKKWECQWPIGEENSGVKGGWRFNWYHRWRLPPTNWWRFYGVMANEDGYTLYEFSDPPILGNDKMPPSRSHHEDFHAARQGYTKAHKNLPYTVHGFSRQISLKSKGSWWGFDIHAPYHRKDGVWNPDKYRSDASEQLPETCVKASCKHHCGGWHSSKKCRLANTVEECGNCKEKDGVIKRDSGAGSFKCKCKKEWDNIKPIGMKKFEDRDAIIWTGYTNDPEYQPSNWYLSKGTSTTQWIMDLTYYRLDDHTFSEEEMEALYLKGRSTKIEG